ncbi:pickpocket protein 28-like [Macrosteles quadrilineatus]|uniref:pickpocket protein 28-like n=1 Tax=Macrosteles quadrilineatus TaxID=74068 RepID=UPI0023E1D4BA|nr:pickpocket protein 28-like [Macrosteles quadrilineatus]
MERKQISIVSNKKLLHSSLRPAWATDNEKKSKKEKPKFMLSTWRLLLQHLAYCCSATSLHCFKYLSDHKCSWKERLLWVCVLSAAVFATCRMISDQFHHYYNNPIVYSTLATRKLIRDIPFPAVTICSHNQIPPSAFNYSETVLKPKDTLTKKEFKRNDFCEEEFPALEWQRVLLVKPCDFLQQVLLWHGHCYTFNMMPFEQLYQPDYTYWYSSLFQSVKPSSSVAGNVEAVFRSSGQHSYSSLEWQSQMPAAPWTTNDSSLVGGAMFTLNFRSHDFDNTCSLGDKSFSVIIHPPDQMADWHQQTHIVQDNSVVLIKVFPEVIEHSKALESLSPSRRGCYINGEKQLRFYQVYNKHNCELECKANISIRDCGCVPYFLPREGDTPVCNRAKSRCLLEAQQNISSKCDCLPSCSGINYSSEMLYIKKHKRIHPL